MDERLSFQEQPQAQNIYMVAGWRQWADAGSISSELPQYLIEQTAARKIGEMRPHGFYVFQVPGTHHMFRPVIQLEEGYRQSLQKNRNEFYYIGDDTNGLIIFIGDEPQINVEQYAETFFAACMMLGVKQVVALGGVYGAMPFDRDRRISCLYSLPHLRADLEDLAVQFSNYEGGATIGAYLVDRAEEMGVAMIDFYAFVPAYNFSQSNLEPQGLSIESDYKAWYDVMRRIKHLFGLSLDLTDLQQRSDGLLTAVEEKIVALEQEMPQLNVREFMAQLEEEFTEQPFMPLGDVWTNELDDLFGDFEES